MRKILAAIICLGLLGISVLAQQTRPTRPRVVTTPAPPQIKGDTSTQTNVKRPPVLQNNKQTPPAQTQSAAPEDEVIVEDDEIIKVETNLVTMPVSVLDRNGRFISGLQQRDFQIFENGVQQKVEYFQSVEQPFTVVLLLDVSNSTAFQINEIQDAAITFIDQLRRDDRVMVLSFDERVHILSQPTNNRTTLRNAILQVKFGGGTSLYDAVDYVIKQQLRSIQGRKAIVLFSDGVDTTSRNTDYQSTIREAEEVDALIYPIRYDTYNDMQDNSGGGVYSPPQRRRGSGGGGTISDILADILSGNVQMGGKRGGGGGGGTSRAEYETGRRYLEDLARNSGGRHFEARDTYNLDTAFASIAEELRRQYSLGYYPENIGQKGERRQIRVRVARPNLVVRAKSSYIVGENTGAIAGQ